MNSRHVYEQIRQQKIIAIARLGVENRRRARGIGKGKIVNVAEALYDAGIKLLEVTCNTDGVFELIKLLCEKVGDKMLIGAGTVITKDLAEKAIDAGACYIVAPDVNPDVIDYCVKNDVAVLPGAATATEILTAKRHGATMAKIFPAAQIGTDYIRALRGPIDDMDFVAVGGVRPENMAEYFDAGCIAIAAGGSIIRKDLVEKGDWQAITDIARKYVNVLIKEAKR